MLLKQSAAEVASAPLPRAIRSTESLRALLDHHAAFLGFVQRRVQDRDLAEDILQSAYVRALQRGDSLRDPDAIVPWFYSILRNAIIDNVRSRRSENGLLERWAAELEENQTSADFSHEVTRGIVCGCIEKLLPTLKPSYAEVLREVDLGGRSLAEFASQHKLTPGNAAVRAHRARAALKQELINTCGVCSLHACLDCNCKSPRHSTDSLK
jgi:RNA polymerase sigma factor (sigma-70 family)